MYDDLINENDDCSSKDKVKIFDYSFIVQIMTLMAGPIPGFDMYLKLTCLNQTHVHY